LAIVRSILRAEKGSLLYLENIRRDSNIDYRILENTWFSPFIQLLTENCCKDDIEARLQSLTFIIFNYDRCTEHFMYYALQNFYRVSNTEAANLIKHITPVLFKLADHHVVC